MKELLSKTRAAIDKYKMIDKGDRIAVGVSGGKDSLVLLCLLNRLSKFYPNRFSIIAVSVDPCFFGQETDYSKIEKLTKELGVEFTVRRSNLYNVVFNRLKEKNPCSLCANIRRGILHNMALDCGCNKIALGHNFEDSIETFFMNLLEGGTLNCFSPKSYLSRKALFLIRPMIFCEENKIISLAESMRLPIIESPCPADKSTNRQQTKELIKELSVSYPGLQTKVMTAMQKAGLSGW